MKINWSILLILLASSGSMAETSTSAKKVKAVKSGAKTSKTWSIGLANTISTNLYKWDSVNHSASNITSLSLKNKIGDGRLSVSTSLNKPLTDGERKEKVGDFGVSYSHKSYSLNTFTSLRPSLKVALPFSESSKDADLRFATTASAVVSWDMTQLGLSKFSLAYIPLVKKNFHEYTAGLYGVNREWTVGNILSLGYGVTNWMSLALEGGYLRNYTYGGTESDVWTFDAATSFVLPKKFGLSIGYSIGGTPLAPNGRDTEIDLFDTEKASVYATLSVSI